jgi:hypothetical protein
MLRKLTLGAVAAVAVGLFAQGASAHEPVKVFPNTGGWNQPSFYPPTYPGYPRPFPPTYPDYPRHDHDYVVFVKHGNHWDRYGRYETLREAERVERFLEHRGLRARIEVVHNHRRW